jgi:hypothetical protein
MEVKDIKVEDLLWRQIYWQVLRILYKKIKWVVLRWVEVQDKKNKQREDFS